MPHPHRDLIEQGLFCPILECVNNLIISASPLLVHRQVKLPSGDYYVKVTDVDGTVSGISGIISVSSAFVRRKAYGPFVEL